MNKLQKNLYDLLLEIDDICKKHDITYLIAGGTALGLVRGGDFMPWDDDIDLYISLDNWNKLRQVMKTELPDNRDFVCEEETPLYCNPIGRYSNKNTTEMRASQILCGRACGQIIEFFIMDPMPLDYREREEFLKLNKAFVELASPYFVVNREIFGINKSFDYDIYNRYYRKGIISGHQKVLNKLRCDITKNSEDKSEKLCGRWGLETLVYDKSWIKDVRYEDFQGHMLPVSSKAEKIFRSDYGDDWMYVPDNDSKIVHNPDKDFETPYETYTKLYMPLIKKGRLLFSYRRNKRASVKGMVNKETAFLKFAKFRAKVFEDHIAKEGYDEKVLKDFLQNREFDKLEDIFADYYQVQLNKYLRDCGIIVDVPAQYIKLALMNRIAQGRYYTVSKIIDFIIENCDSLALEIQEVIDAYYFCKNISIALYDESDLKKVDDILETNLKYENNIVDFARAKLWSQMKKSESIDDYISLVSSAREAIKKYGQDGELIRFEAYGLYGQGNMSESKARYNVAIKNTRNGFVWREAKDLFQIDPYMSIDEETFDFALNKKIKSMLIEIDKICMEYGLNYVLINPDKPCIAMVDGDIEKLIKIINDKKSDRQIEYLLNNPRANGFEYRYCDNSTTEICLKDFRNYSNNGIHIDILEISKVPSKKIKKKLFLKKMIMYCGNIQYRGILNWELVIGSTLIKFFIKLFGEQRIKKNILLFKKQNVGIDSWEDIKLYEYVNIGNKKIQTSMLSPHKEVYISGVKFRTLDNVQNLGMIIKPEKDSRATEMSDSFLSFNDVMRSEYRVLLEGACKQYDRYMGHYLWSGFYKLYIKHAQWVYLMTRDYVSFKRQYDDFTVTKIEKMINDGLIEDAKRELRPYVVSKNKWIKRKVKFLTIPEIENLLAKIK